MCSVWVGNTVTLKESFMRMTSNKVKKKYSFRFCFDTLSPSAWFSGKKWYVSTTSPVSPPDDGNGNFVSLRNCVVKLVTYSSAFCHWPQEEQIDISQAEFFSDKSIISLFDKVYM